MIATLLVEVATCRFKSDNNEENIKQVSEQLQAKVRLLESQALTQLLTLYQFNQSDIELYELPIKEGQWELDFFLLIIYKSLVSE